MTADHWCVAYGAEAELGVSAADLLSEGVARGEHVGYFGWGRGDELRGRLLGLVDVDARGGWEAARIGSFDERFRRDEPPDPLALVSFWADATNVALVDGFAGLRVVADTTPWAALGQMRRAVFLRAEQLVNQYRLDHPFTLICACDASLLESDALADTVCIHPSSRGVATPFRLHATEEADFALHGEIDAFTVPLLERVLDSVPRDDGNGEVVIEAAGLAFIEHGALLALERYAERSGASRVVLQGASQTAGQLIELLGLRRVQAEAPR